MDLLTTARAASGCLHAAIEKTAFATSLAGGTVRRADYVRYLSALAVVHETVEAHLEEEPLHALPSEGAKRAGVARADRQALGGSEDDEAFESVERWKAALEFHKSGSGWVWAGALYVLEGSRMGSRMLIQPISMGLNVPAQPGCGIDYHLAAVADRGASWQAFKGFLTAATPSDADREAFAEGVRMTFQMMNDLYAELSSPALALV
jgi:heme oxygenase